MHSIRNDIRVILNNLTVSCNDEGPDDAPVIIFIHGFPLNKSMWNSQVKALKDDYRVIAYDIRGHGNSDAGNEDFSIDLFVRDLICFMDALKIDKTMLCGLSMGGYIALNAIENFPERFYALVLSDTNCLADTPEGKEKRMNSIESIRENSMEKYADESLKKLFAPESFTTNVEEIAAVREMIMKTSRQTLYNTLHALAERKETCSKLPEIKVPVLILVGKEDIITPPDAALLINEKIKGSLLKIIDHAGHLSNLENSADFNNHLKKFVSLVIQESDKFLKEIRPDSDRQNLRKTTKYEDAERDLNAEILKATMTIKDQFPELSKYLEEMPVTIPDEKDPEITLNILKTYYESLNSLLSKYKLEHPFSSDSCIDKTEIN